MSTQLWTSLLSSGTTLHLKHRMASPIWPKQCQLRLLLIHSFKNVTPTLWCESRRTCSLQLKSILAMLTCTSSPEIQLPDPLTNLSWWEMLTGHLGRSWLIVVSGRATSDFQLAHTTCASTHTRLTQLKSQLKSLTSKDTQTSERVSSKRRCYLLMEQSLAGTFPVTSWLIA